MTDDEMQSRCRALDLNTTRYEREVYYLEKQISDLERLMEARFEAQERSVLMAREAMNARLAGMNEFRAQIEDRTETFALGAVVDTNYREMARRVGNLENRMATYDGRIVGWSAGVGFVVLVLSIVAQLLGLGG